MREDDYGADAESEVRTRGYREFINYPGSFFFVKGLVTPPLPSCLPNRVCFRPKMVCFSFFRFLFLKIYMQQVTHYMCVV